MLQPVSVAVRYLSGLKRVSVPSLADVRRKLLEQMPNAPQLWLDFGGPAECFEIELERIALEVDFKMTMKSTKRCFNRESIPAQYDADIDFALKEGLVREASDGFQKMYRGSSILLRIIENSFEAWIPA